MRSRRAARHADLADLLPARHFLVELHQYLVLVDAERGHAMAVIQNRDAAIEIEIRLGKRHDRVGRRMDRVGACVRPGPPLQYEHMFARAHSQPERGVAYSWI